MPKVTGKLTDFGLDLMAGSDPKLTFKFVSDGRPTSGIAGVSVLANRDVDITPAANSYFEAELTSTERISPAGYYVVTLMWRDRLRRHHFDILPGRLYVPEAGGVLADLLRVPSNPALVWTGPKAPANPSPGSWWHDPETGDLSEHDGKGWNYKANLRGPAGYNAIGAEQDMQALANYVNQSAGTNPFAAALFAKFAPAANAAPNNVILCIGTSITNGTGAASPATAYPALIEKKLPELLPGIPYTVIAGGVSGNTSTEMLARLVPLLNKHRPRIVYIETSINDTRDDRQITPADTARNVRTMVGLVRAFGAIPIIGTSAPIVAATWGAPYSTSSEPEARLANLLVRAAAAELNVQLVDIEAMYGGKPTHLSDGIHPNPQGHDEWATNIARAIAGLQPVTFAGPVITDTFDRADNAETLGITEKGLLPWLYGGIGGGTPASVFGISNGQARPVIINGGTNNWGSAVAAFDDRMADFVLDVTVSKIVPGSTGVVFRFANTNNFWLVFASPAGSWQLLKFVNGAFQTVVNAGPAAKDGDLVTVTAKGNSINVKINGTQPMTATDSFEATATLKGFWASYLGAGSRWDSIATAAPA